MRLRLPLHLNSTSKPLHIQAAKITLHTVKLKDGEISIGDFTACAILLNNGLSSDRPKIAAGTGQNLIPLIDADSFQRFESDHFHI